MQLQRALRNYMRQYFPREVHNEPWCTCGSANHVRTLLFRVNGQPTTVVVPEGCELSAAQMRRAIPGAQVEPLAPDELDAIYASSELGQMQPFDNPFGANVYLDENLLHFDTLVFCPQMFGGKKGECFRVPTKDFRTAVQALVLPLFPAFEPAQEA